MKPLEVLRALGTGSEPPAETKQRVYGALLASLEVAAMAGATAQVIPKGPVPLPPAPAPLLAGAVGSKALLVATGIWLLGGAMGAALYGALHPQQVRVVYVDRPVLAKDAAEIAKIAENTGNSRAAAPASSAVPSPSSRRAGAAPPVPGSAARDGSELAGERALLDSARASAARGEPALVLEQVAQHLLKFPHGRLAEEREALAIRALLSLGRSDEARSRANAFRSAYPHSFLTPVIDSALSAP